MARSANRLHRLVFALAVAGAAALALTALAAPLLEARRSPLAAELYALLGGFCHQRPSRSWFLAGSNLGLCVRAFSLYGTVALVGAAVLASLSVRRRLRRLGAAAGGALLVPLLVDGVGQLLGLWTSTTASRAVTGALAGVGLVRLLGPADAPSARPRLELAPRLVRAAAAALVAGLLLPAPALAQAGRMKLPAGTPIFLVFPDSVTSESASEGQLVSLRVTRDVKVGDAVVIPSGARATARVAAVRRPAGWGEPGSLTVYVSEVYAVDGQNVPLSATQQTRGQDKQSSAAVTGIIAGVLCLPSALWGFAIKGDEGRILAGTELKAYTEVDALVALGASRPAAH